MPVLIVWRVSVLDLFLLLLAAPFPALFPMFTKIGANLRELFIATVFLAFPFCSTFVFNLPLLEEWINGSIRWTWQWCHLIPH